MLINTTRIKIPSMTVLLDLASRDGAPTIDSPCPYEGLGEYFREHSLNVSGDMLKKLSEIKDSDDFNAKAICVQPGKYVQQSDKDKPYLKYFEGGLHDGVQKPKIDISWLRTRLGNIMFNIREQKGGFKDDRRLFKVRTPIPDSESGAPIDSAEKLEIPRRCSELDILEYKVKLPYLVKRLHSYGVSKGVHIMSLIIAHEKAKEMYKTDRKHNITNKDLYPQVLDTTQDGDILLIKGEPVYLRANTGPFQSWGFNWVVGRTKSLHDDYYNDMLDLVVTCHRLGINLTEEDPTIYTNEFIESLTVTYIKTNKEYISKQVIREIDLAEFEDIYSEDSYDEDESAVDIDSSNIYSLCKNKEVRFLLSDDIRITDAINKVNKTDKVNSILTMYNIIGENVPKSTRKLFTENGFYRNADDSPLLLNANYLVNKEREIKDYKCLVHSSGLLLLVTEKNSLEILDIEMAIQYIKTLFSNCDNNGVKKSYILARYKHIINSINIAYGSFNQPYGTWTRI